jgi:hypothetical protein
MWPLVARRTQIRSLETTVTKVHVDSAEPSVSLVGASSRRRYWGESGGEPRAYENPCHKFADVSSAASFLSAKPGVNAERLIGLGIDMSGFSGSRSLAFRDRRGEGEPGQRLAMLRGQDSCGARSPTSRLSEIFQLIDPPNSGT